MLGYNIFFEGNSTPINASLITNTSYLIPIPGQEIVYTYKLTAMYQQGESDPANCLFKNNNNPEVLDSLALVALYNQCDGSNWTKKNNWLAGAFHTWQGVTVENGRVVMLNMRDDLNSVGLDGSIPFEFSNLTELKMLDLSNNKLKGGLPLKFVNFSEFNSDVSCR